MKYRFTDLVDTEAFSAMLKSFYEATGILHGLVDEQNNVISAIGWQEACAVYHRVHPRTRERCEKSNRYLSENLVADGYIGCQCDNGLMDYAAAIIIEGQQLATLYFGQIFHELPDLEFFRRQALACGFDENAYLTAIRKVPVMPKERINAIMAFYAQQAQMLASSGLDRLRLLQATDNLRRLSEQRELEREEERKRIGHEIHEELGQYLTALKLQLSSLLIEAGNDNAGLVQRGERMKTLLDETFGVARGVLVSIRPAALNGGIGVALEWLAGEFSRNTNIRCEFTAAPPSPNLDEERAVVLFRVAEESLNNIARHAHADQVLISLSSRNDTCWLEIQDNGRGFATSPDGARRIGVNSMHERVLAQGGLIAIDSQPGQGTTIRVSLPIPAASAAG